tara:strand:+ start:774 stop:1478 length:705 start_codon:yes stop_codon:yes gene_type:complete
MDPRVEFYAGCISGLAQNIIGHPFDTLKIYIQNKKTIDLGPTVKTQFRQYYRGFAYPTTLAMILNGTTFQMNAFLSNYLIPTNNPNKSNHYYYYSNGFCTGLITSPLVFAFEVGKIKRQMNQPLYWNSIFSTHGFSMTCCRESIAVSIYLGSYYHLRDKNVSPFISGGIAGFLNWLFTYPIDVIKNRQTSQNITVQQAIQMGSLWKGFRLCALRGILVNSIGFYVYDWCKTEVR